MAVLNHFHMFVQSLITAFIILLLGVLLLPALVYGNDLSVVINEIGAYESSGQEWIEIVNISSDPVDITGWSFWEDETNHGLKLVQGADMILDPQEFAIIVQKDTDFLTAYPQVSTTIIDSAWGSLKESGESIGLKNNDGVLVEEFTYIAAPDFSLERIDSNLQDYSSNNWKEHHDSNSIGVQNSASIMVSSTPEDAQTEEEPTSKPEDVTDVKEDDNGTGISFVPTNPGAVLINEFVSDPQDGQYEFIELFNTTEDDIDMTGWWLQDGSETHTPLEGTLSSRAYILIEQPKGKLNNSGDMVVLRDLTGNIVDQITYGNWDDGSILDNAPAPAEPYSLIRLNARDTDDDQSDFSLTTTMTPGKENIFVNPVGLEIKEDVKQAPIEEPLYDGPITVRISEIHANPAGSDAQNEFIELHNYGSNTILLDNWQVSDATEKTYTIEDVSLQPDAYFAIYRASSSIALNNSGDERVELRDPNGTIVDDQAYYNGAPESLSYAIDDDNEWFWTSMITPHGKNIIHQSIEPTETVTDKQEPEIESTHTTIEPDMTEPEVVITPAQPTQAWEAIQLSEILPNPIGPDAAGEFIELYNPLPTLVDLEGLILDDTEGGSKGYHIPENTFIAPFSYRFFARSETGIALNNTSDQARILNPDRTILQNITYDSTIEGSSFIPSPDGASWSWTQQPTPGQPNIYAAVQGEKIADHHTDEPSYFDIELSQVVEQDIGDRVTTQGIVTALPGTLGSQYFYIGNASSGVQVYMYKKAFPSLALGDRVRVNGELSLSGEQTRIKTSNQEDIDKIDHPGELDPTYTDIAAISERYQGMLVRVRGEITEKKTTSLYIDDGTDEIKVYIKRGTKIDMTSYAVGTTIELHAILTKTKSDYQLLPRKQEDIRMITTANEHHAPVYNKKAPQGEPEKRSVSGYLFAFFLGITVILVGLIVKTKGNAWITSLANTNK